MGPIFGFGHWGARPCNCRNSASDGYGFFKEVVLMNGDYKDAVKEQPGSASVVQGITADRFGMGYSGIGYKTSGVKNLALTAKAGGEYSNRSYEDAVAGKYPLSRFLYLYVNRARARAGPRGARVPEVRLQPRGPGDRRQGRLLPLPKVVGAGRSSG